MENGSIDLHHIPDLLTGPTIFDIEEEFFNRETFFSSKTHQKLILHLVT